MAKILWHCREILHGKPSTSIKCRGATVTHRVCTSTCTTWRSIGVSANLAGPSLILFRTKRRSSRAKCRFGNTWQSKSWTLVSETRFFCFKFIPVRDGIIEWQRISHTTIVGWTLVDVPCTLAAIMSGVGKSTLMSFGMMGKC